MLTEALEMLVSLVKAGDQGEFEPGQAVKNRQSLWIQGGNHEWIDHDPPVRLHRVESLDSLLHIATRYKDTCSVWHSHKSVTVMVDDEWRDDQAAFTLETTQAWQAAMGLKDGKAQGTIVDLFRCDLKDVIEESHPELIGLFKNVKFKRRDEAAAEIDHGRESMGRQLEQQVTGTDKLPEEITLTLRPYIAVESESQVRFALKVNYQGETFAFRPVGDDVQTAIDAAQDVIRERFSGVTDKVYYGTP